MLDNFVFIFDKEYMYFIYPLYAYKSTSIKHQRSPLSHIRFGNEIILTASDPADLCTKPTNTAGQEKCRRM